MKKFLTILVLVFVSTQTFGFAWVYTQDTSIKELIQWEGNSPKVVITLQNGTRCYIPTQEKELYSLALSLYMAQKKINIHCHEAEVNVGGYPSHKVHRIIAK
jgi:hypothetical protein